MDYLLILALALISLGYVFFVIYRVLTSFSKDRVLKALKRVALFKVALTFLVLSVISGFVSLLGAAGGVAGSGTPAKGRQALELLSSISVFFFFVSLAFAGAALFRYATGKKAP